MSSDGQMHLAWCVDDRVHTSLMVAVGSALGCSRSMPVAIHVVTTGMSSEHVDRLRRLCDRLGAARFDVTEVDPARIRGLKSTEWIPVAAYLRFFLPSLFPQLDRLLYMDSDVLVRQDLAPLWETPLDGLACVGSDKAWAHDSRYCSQIGLAPTDVYVNAGVLLMNLEKFREEALGDKMLAYAQNPRTSLPSVDQDVLNVVLRGKIGTVPSRWNYTSYEFRERPEEAPKAAILHFTGSEKPWSEGRRSLDWRDRRWQEALREIHDTADAGVSADGERRTDMRDLTIIMPTWNKEKYIAEALDSVFAQETSFTYGIVVADDHSTDRTLEIVADYERRHPGVFTVLRSETNQKLFRNVRRAYAVCRTPYFCVLDPDDYWTDVRHLDKALSFLSAHPRHTIYSAGIERLYPDGTRDVIAFPEKPVDSDFRDYLRQRAAVAFTQTCVYRNVVFANGLPPLVENPTVPSMEKSFRGDSFRNFLHLRLGKAHFVPGVEACYRITDEGIYQGVGEVARHLRNAEHYADMWRYDDGKYPSLLELSRAQFRQALERLPDLLAHDGGDVGKLRALAADMLALRALYAERLP